MRWSRLPPIHFVGHGGGPPSSSSRDTAIGLVAEADGARNSAPGSEPKVSRWYPDGHQVSPAISENQRVWRAERIGRRGRSSRF